MRKNIFISLIALALVLVGLNLNAQVTRTSTPATGIGDNNCSGGDGTGGVSDSIAFTEVSAGITDVDVRVAIDHTWRPDLQFHVTYSGGGGSVLMVADHGLTSNDDYYATFDDEAGTSCAAAANCGSGAACSMTSAPGPSCIPDSALSAFDGLATPGTFSIVVCDDSAALTGTLQEWAVTADGPPELPVELVEFGIE